MTPWSSDPISDTLELFGLLGKLLKLLFIAVLWLFYPFTLLLGRGARRELRIFIKRVTWGKEAARLQREEFRLKDANLI